MLIEPMIQQLHQLRLRGMAAGLEQLLRGAQHQSLSFEERLGVMIQHEITERDSKRLAQRLRWAKLEPLRLSRRLHTLRGWSHESNVKTVFAGSQSTGGADGRGPP